MAKPLNTTNEQWLQAQLRDARERIIELENQLIARRLERTLNDAQKVASPPPEPPPEIQGTMDVTEPKDTMRND